MSGWSQVQIGRVVADVNTWNPQRDAPGDTFMYVDLGAVDQETKRIVEAREVACSDAPSRARQLLLAGDILVSTVRPNLNGVARVDERFDGATGSTGFCVLRPQASRLDGSFLFHWVKAPDFVRAMVANATGASYPAVSDKIVRESQLLLPPLADQRRIADILDRAEALRAKRREALGKLDELVGAVFVEMFGATGSARWPSTALGDLVSEFRYGTSNKSGPEGLPALRIPNVVGGTLDLSELKQVQVEAAELDRLRLRDGDLLFVRTNGNPDYVGRCAVFEESAVVTTPFDPASFIYASYLIRARPKPAVVDPVFLREFFSSTDGRKQLRERAKTSAGQFNINTEGLGSLQVPAHPLRTQQTFARRVAAIDRIKASHRRSLAELDALFATLQHRAFRGEL
jgi:type I restriction enzyme S subunit